MKHDSESMLIYPGGAIVRTKVGNVEGMITACSIRFEKANYEITYFMGAEHKTMWMFEEGFETESEKQKIGFK